MTKRYPVVNGGATFRRRGTFTAFVWTEAMGEGGPVNRYYGARLEDGSADHAFDYFGVNPGGGCGNVQRVFDGCVVVTDEQGKSWCMLPNDFDEEYEAIAKEQQ